MPTSPSPSASAVQGQTVPHWARTVRKSVMPTSMSPSLSDGQGMGPLQEMSMKPSPKSAKPPMRIK